MNPVANDSSPKDKDGAHKSLLKNALRALDEMQARLDAAEQARAGEGAQHVVDGLVRHHAELVTDGIDDGIRARVRRGVDCTEDGQSRAGDPKVVLAQQLLELRCGGHVSSVPSFWSKSRVCRKQDTHGGMLVP